MNISEEAIQLLAAYKHEIAQWRMQKPQWAGDWWLAHDSAREASATITESRTVTYTSERFKTEDECKTWVQLRSLTVALASIRACAS